MAHVSANIVEFYTKVEEHRVNEKYADVTIECQGKVFKCHRVILAAASQFFDTMFSSEFKESTNSTSITLPETNAETFEAVVTFIYTGDVYVTFTNVNSLLEASECFQLPGIDDLCTKFIETHKLGVPWTLNAFVFACRTNKQVLIDRLCEDILEYFKIFSRADEFLEMPFEALRIILSRWSSPRAEEVKIGATVRWVSHNKKERIGHICDLIEMMRFGNVISDEYVRCVFKKLWTDESHHGAGGNLTRSLKPVDFGHILQTRRGMDIEMEKNVLRVYVRSTAGDAIGVISVDNNGRNCSIVIPAKNLVYSSPRQWVQSVSVDNLLYRFEYALRMEKDAERSNQTFSIHTSAYMMDESLNLMPPPICFGDVRLRALGNNIYAYHKTVFLQLGRTSAENLTRFDDEEINRGVYTYNCELDNWFPVPAMKKQLQRSCMVGWNDQILFLIDGQDSLDHPVKYVQVYDCRVGMWQEMPNSNTAASFADGDACVHNGKIYVSGGGHAYFEVFDPIACKWETAYFDQRMYSPMRGHRTISYANKLWALGDVGIASLSDHLSSIQFCSFQTTEPGPGRKVIDTCWSPSNVLKDAAGDFSSDLLIMDVLIF